MSAEAAVAAVALLAARAYRDRPRGWARADLLVLSKSPVAGIGLFARCEIPEGTVLGCYPGRPRTEAEMMAKAATAPGTRQYVFSTGLSVMFLLMYLTLLMPRPQLEGKGIYLDPTGSDGTQPVEYPSPGPWWPLSIQIELAYANEPLAGSSGPNCQVEDGSDEADLLFVASRDIRAGGEVLIDYGTHYDRSGYRS